MTEPVPALNPPVAGDPLNLAEVAAPGQRYDIVIDGVGYMLWAQDDDSLPSRIYQIVPETLTYSQQFIERTNVSGDFGDNQQDFFMTYTMRDWSGGEGQKFFRQQTDKDRTYWDGATVRPTEEPGQVVVGPKEESLNSPTGLSSDRALNLCFVKNTTDTATSDAIVAVTLPAATSTTVSTYYSTDGGSNWTSMCGTSKPTTCGDVADIIAGDDRNIYMLVKNFNSGHSKIFSCVTAASSWTAHTALSLSFHGIEWYNNALYGIAGNATLYTIDVSGGGSDGTATSIKDLGGGQIVDMLAAGGVLYLLYCSSQGDYRLMQYDGTDVVEIARLSKGWKMPKPCEGSESSGSGTLPRRIRCMAYQDGIIYISGSIPSNDALISQGNTYTYRGALWFFDGGDSGLLWQSNSMLQAQQRAGGAVTVIDGGIVVFADHVAERLMAYDPRTGGVFSLSTITSVLSGSSIPPLWRLEYDPGNHVLLGVWEKDFDRTSDPYYTSITDLKINRWKLRSNAAASGSISTSLFDFDSSLPKYFSGVTINGILQPYSGDSSAGTFDIYYQLDGIDGSYTLLKSGATPGTEYRIDQKGYALSIKVVLNNNSVYGPALTRVAVRAAPIQQIFRQRAYVLALLDDVPRLDGSEETLTPTQQRKALETSLTKQTPINVSDESMTNVAMVFDANNTEIRMIRKNEYIAFVSLREV